MTRMVIYKFIYYPFKSVHIFLVITDVITFMTISSCGKHLVIADPGSNIAIYTLQQNKWKFYAKLPKHQAPPTAMSINNGLMNLVVAYSDNKVKS